MPQGRDPLQDLKQTHKTLKDLGIPHALTGGWAVIAWGGVRTTSDLDILVLIGHPSRPLINKAFQELGYQLEWRKGGSDDPIPEILRLTPRNDVDRPEIDFLLALKGFDLDALDRAVPVSLGGWIMPVLRPEDLIAMKLSAGGGVDFQDVKSLLAIHAKTLDQALLENSCRRLKVSNLLRNIRGADL